MSGSILSIPFLAYGLLYTQNFHISLICYAIQVFVSGTYSGPAITMMQNTSPSD
jgi:hypothetical protein